MRLAGQLAQHPVRVGRISRLAQNLRAQRHRGVGTQNRRLRQLPARMACHGSVQFQAGDTHHIVTRGFTGQHGLDGLGILGHIALHIGQQQDMAHPHLLQQLAAARALRGKVEIRQGGHGASSEIGSFMAPQKRKKLLNP